MIIEAIKSIYPDIQDTQYALQDDGAGPYIKKWTYPEEQPTKERIDAAIQELTARAAIPSSVSIAQARLAMFQTGILDQVDSIITSSGGSAQIEWEFRQTVERSHPLVDLVKSQLPLTDAQIDNLFVLAATL